MGDLHTMPITHITHSACYTVEMGVSAVDLTRTTLDNNHTAYRHICLQGIGCVCVKNYPPEITQPSPSMRATIVSAANQNGATIVEATFIFCHHYIVWDQMSRFKCTPLKINSFVNLQQPVVLLSDPPSHCIMAPQSFCNNWFALQNDSPFWNYSQ